MQAFAAGEEITLFGFEGADKAHNICAFSSVGTPSADGVPRTTAAGGT